MAALSELLFERNQLDQAETLARECLALRKEKEPGRWSTSYTQCLLGAILVRQDDFEQAEPMLKEGYAGLQQQAHRVARMEREATLAKVKGWLAELPAESGSHN